MTLQERNRLITKHIGLAQQIAKMSYTRTYKDYHEYDDILSSCYLGLIAAADSYDTNNTTSFSSWANIKIKYTLIDELRKMTGSRKQENQTDLFPLDAICTNDDNTSTYLDMLQDNHLDSTNYYDGSIEDKLTLSMHIDKLTYYQKRTIDYTLQGYSQVEMAKLFNRSVVSVCSQFNKAIHNLKYYCNE